MGSLKLENVRKSFGKVDVLKGIDLEVTDGEFVVFVGPSGCGKSTLLRIIAGLEDLTGGDVRIDGEKVDHVPPAQRGIAMVFQTYALYPHLTVKNNMGLGLKQAGTPAAEIEKRIAASSAMLSLEPYLERRPAELSGGQRQRVAIGRALVREPKLFLFDEPLSNLDAALRVNTRLEIAQLHRRLKATMIYVTHDQVEAMTLADKIVVLRAGQVEQVGAPLELYDDPANMFVAGFIGSPRMNFLKAKVTTADGGRVTVGLASQPQVQLTLPVAADIKVGDEISLGIRPERFVAEGAGEADLPVEVDVVEHLGNTSYVYAHVAADERIIIEREGSRATISKDRLTVGLAVGNIYLFDSAGQRLK